MQPLPSSVESERAFFGACFLRPAIITQASVDLLPENFYLDAHRLIFTAMIDLGERTEPTAVAAWLRQRGYFAPTDMQIMDLSECVSTSAGWSFHVGVIKDKATRREIIQACSRAVDAAQGLDDCAEVLSDLKDRVRSIGVKDGKPYRDNLELVNAVWKDIERRSEADQHFVGLATGFQGIDSQVFGLEPRTTTYLVARPSTGKTALALNIAENAPGRVLFFSLESNAEAITRRRMAAKSKVFLWRIRTATLEPGQDRRLMNAANELCESSVIVFDNPRFRWIENLTAQCESMAMDGPISLIVIDHIGRLRTRRKTENQNILLGTVSDEISDLAKGLNVPILVLCQLNRQIENRPVKQQYPRLADIRESGRIEENADNVIGLWRKDKEAEETRLEWLKGRDVGTFTCYLRFDRQIQRFYDSEEKPLIEVEENYMDKL